MNFGYNKDCKGWKEDRKWKLAERLSRVLNIPIETGNKLYKNDGRSPYIEVDGNYEGVRIRRITYLTDKEHDLLITEAELVYSEVMDTCEVCGKKTEDKSGFCDKCFSNPKVQKALFRI